MLSNISVRYKYISLTVSYLMYISIYLSIYLSRWWNLTLQRIWRRCESLNPPQRCDRVTDTRRKTLIEFRGIGHRNCRFAQHIFVAWSFDSLCLYFLSFNADSLNWLPTNPEFRVGDLQYCLDRFVIQHCQHIALCFCTIALA